MPIPVAKKAARDSRYRGVIYGLAPGLDFALCRALDLLLGFALAAGAALSLALLAAAFAGPANAAEGATQFYLLGTRANATAGITPPPGIYFQNDFYIYDGKGGGGKVFPHGGQLIVDVRGRAYVDLPTLLWVTPANVFGGNLAFSLTQPFGGPHVKAGARVASPLLGAVLATGVSDSATVFGDPAVTGFVGWHAGNFHWQVGTIVNVPIGDYREGAIANLAFNRWMADFFASGTWFDPQTGFDISGALGFTVNGENPATNYRSGNEFHAELALTRYFTKQFSLGVIGYYYNQFTGDSGSGATLGPFKGRVAAIGGSIGYNFELGHLPVTTRLKVFREFDAVNRLEGTAAYITVAMPLWVAGAPAPAAVPPIRK